MENSLQLTKGKGKHKIMTIPMVPIELRAPTEVEGFVFSPGWYGVFVDQNADQFISSGFVPYDKQDNAHMHCMAWNMGQLGLTRKQCGNILSLWGQPVLKPFLYENAKKLDLWPKEAQ
jgi:hypothetical protein